MKLMNHTQLILSAILFVTVSLRALLFYTQLLKQVRDSYKDTLLENYLNSIK